MVERLVMLANMRLCAVGIRSNVLLCRAIAADRGGAAGGGVR